MNSLKFYSFNSFCREHNISTDDKVIFRQWCIANELCPISTSYIEVGWICSAIELNWLTYKGYVTYSNNINDTIWTEEGIKYKKELEVEFPTAVSILDKNTVLEK